MDNTGLTASALARAAGMSPSTLTRFLAGQSKSVLSLVSLAKIQKVAARYGGTGPDTNKAADNASERILLAAFRDLTESEQEALIEYVDFLMARRGRRQSVKDGPAGQ